MRRYLAEWKFKIHLTQTQRFKHVRGLRAYSVCIINAELAVEVSVKLCTIYYYGGRVAKLRAL